MLDKMTLLSRAVSFQEVKQGVFSQRCFPCHTDAGGNKGGVNLENHGNAFAKLPNILRATIENPTMPPGGQSLSKEEFQLLNTWIRQGGTSNGQLTASTNQQQGPGEWNEIQNGALRSCADCHSQPNPDGNLDLTTLESVRMNAVKIFERVVVLRNMPPSPPYPELSTEDKLSLAQWIAIGMP